MTTPHEKALEAARDALRSLWREWDDDGHPDDMDDTQTVVQAYLTSLSEQWWKMVPVEPTEEMVTRAKGYVLSPSEHSVRFAYSAMLAAAPREGE